MEKESCSDWQGAGWNWELLTLTAGGRETTSSKAAKEGETARGRRLNEALSQYFVFLCIMTESFPQKRKEGRGKESDTSVSIY